MKDKNGQALAYNCEDGARPIVRLALARTRVHRSEVMFSVLVVVLCRNRIAILSFSVGQRQISFIGLFALQGNEREAGSCAGKPGANIDGLCCLD